MNKILRVLALVGVVSLAAIPPVVSDDTSLCTWKCFRPDRQPRVVEVYGYFSYEDCCSGENTVCPPDSTLIYATWGDPQQYC